MRIDTFAQIQQLYGSTKPAKPAKTTTTSFRDQLELSSAGKEVGIAKQAIAASPDIREDVTAPIKAEIQNGTYAVDEGDFAAKLIGKYI